MVARLISKVLLSIHTLLRDVEVAENVVRPLMAIVPATESVRYGEEVARPTLPMLLMLKNVEVTPAAVEEPTVKTILFTGVDVALMATSAPGVVVPTPTRPPLFIRKYVEVVEPTTNAGPVSPSACIESTPHGVVLPIPTLRLDFEMVNAMFVPNEVEDAISNDLSAEL